MSQLQKDKESQEIEEEVYKVLNENDKVRYELQLFKKNNKIKEMLIAYRRYPLLDKGYGNYEELNVDLQRRGKGAKVEIFLIRDSWNGSGRYTLCETKLRNIDDSFFAVHINSDNDVKEVVLKLLNELKGILAENPECDYALLYFPE